jgi:hypothetical protein
MASPAPKPPLHGTVLETDEDARQSLKPSVAVAGGQIPIAQPVASSAPAAKPYHPTLRPTIAVLTVFDDGKSDGEVVRIRTERFVIGRSEGDFLDQRGPLRRIP